MRGSSRGQKNNMDDGGYKGMSREIKFRGKRLDNGEWIHGSLLDGDIIVSGPVDADDEYIGLGEWSSVDPDTLGQYTGMEDRNGKEIYGRDILDGSYINPMSGELIKRLYEVAYERGRYLAKLIGHHPYGTTMLYFENGNGEVIGNVYDNPELLEVSP